jgi:hypothetical protein
MMVVTVPGVLKISAIGTTTNDVVFAIGANGYSTVGPASSVQEIMPSPLVFE